MVRSDAFRGLSKSSILVLMDFLLKRRIKVRKAPNGSKIVNILNNGEIEYCFSEAEKKGLNRNTFNNSLMQLVEVGFIDISHQGSGGRKGDKNLYAISERWRKWGTKDFVFKTKDKDERRGIGFALMHKNKNR